MTPVGPFPRPQTRRTQQGAAALELALVLMPLILIMTALVSLGVFFLAKQGLARAASEGARAMASASLVGPVHADSACGVVSAVLARTSGWVGASPRCDVWPAANGVACGAAGLACVHVRVRYCPQASGFGVVLGMMEKVSGRGASDDPGLSGRLWAQSTVQFSPPVGSTLTSTSALQTCST